MYPGSMNQNGHSEPMDTQAGSRHNGEDYSDNEEEEEEGEEKVIKYQQAFSLGFGLLNNFILYGTGCVGVCKTFQFEIKKHECVDLNLIINGFIHMLMPGLLRHI